MTCLAHHKRSKKLRQEVLFGRLSAKRDTLLVIHPSMNKLDLTKDSYQVTYQT